MTIEATIDTRAVKKLFARAPGRLGKAFRVGARRGLQRYRPLHRRERMSRKATSDPVGIYAQGKREPLGLKQDKWFKINELGSKLSDSGAEIRVRHLILRQLEYGATLKPKRGTQMAVPFSRHQKKGKPSKRIKRLMKERKLTLIRRANGDAYLVEKKGRKKDKLVFLFHLQSTIKVPARLEYQKQFKTREARELAFKEMNKAFNAEVRRIARGR